MTNELELANAKIEMLERLLKESYDSASEIIKDCMVEKKELKQRLIELEQEVLKYKGE